MAYKNPEAQKASQAKIYQANKEKYKERSKIGTNKAIARNKEFIAKYFETHHCVDCGNSNPIVFEFDHIAGTKRFNVSQMVGQGFSIKLIEEEIAKCEVRCANCHRTATYNRRHENFKVY